MAGKLYIVGTPIGNLKDITLRALETLKGVDFIACEDTRVSLKLLSAYEIKKPLISYYKQKEQEGAEKISSLLAEGKSVALITDAGMPGISDPGAVLISKCRAENVEIVAVPGPTALTSAVSLVGLTQTGFTFLGFLPEKIKDKQNYIKDYMYSPLPLVFYCSPHDINAYVKFLFEALGDRKIYVVKEITKMFECVTEHRLEGFFMKEPKGEFVLIVMPSEGGCALNSLTVREQVAHYMQSGLLKKDAIKRTASDRGVDKNSIYSEVLDLSDTNKT